MFMREGTPSGFSTMSTGVPSARYGMSSTGTIVEMTPLLPWRPAILSPGCTRRFTARYTFTILSTPGARSSPAVILAFFSSRRFSSALRCSFRRSEACSSWLLASSSSRRISNHDSRGHFVEVRRFDLALEAVRAAGGDLADEHVAHAREQVVFEDALLVAQVLADLLDLRLLDRQRARVLVDAVAREHAHVDDRAVHARGHAQRRVLHVATPSRRRWRAAVSLPA